MTVHEDEIYNIWNISIARVPRGISRRVPRFRINNNILCNLHINIMVTIVYYVSVVYTIHVHMCIKMIYAGCIVLYIYKNVKPYIIMCATRANIL